MPDSRAPFEGRSKFADRSKPTVSSLDGRQPKTSLRFMVVDDSVTSNDTKLNAKKFSTKTSSELKSQPFPKSPTGLSKSPGKFQKNPSLSSNNVFGGGGGGDMFSFDSSTLSKHTLRQEPKKQTTKQKLAPTSNTASLRRAPEAVFSSSDGGVNPGSPTRRGMNKSSNNNSSSSSLLSTGKLDEVGKDTNTGFSELNSRTLNSNTIKSSGTGTETTSALQSFLHAPGTSSKQVDKSGFFTNFALMEELKTSEQAVEYFLKRQSHKFPVKFLHLVPKDPGHSGFYPYDLEVVSQEVAEAADRHYVMTESGMTAFAHVEVEDPSLAAPVAVEGSVDKEHGDTNPPAVPPSQTETALSQLSADEEEDEPESQILPSTNNHAVSSTTKHKPLHKGNHDAGGQGKPKFIVTETMSLGHWVSERNNYRVISQRLRFFSQYLIRKAFGNWFTMMRIRQYARLRNRMASNLSWSSPALAPVAVNLKKGSDQMRHVSLIMWEHPQTHKRTAFTTKAFTEIQAVEKANAEKDLDITARAIGDFFVAVTEELERKKLPPSSQDSIKEASAASQSIVGQRLKAEAAAKRAKEYTALINKMPTLGRLGQYTCFEALVGAAVSSCVAGFAAIHAPRRGVGLFETHLSFVRSAKFEALEQEAAGKKKEEEESGLPAVVDSKKRQVSGGMDETEEEEERKAAEAAYMREVLKDELVFSPTCDELVDTVISTLGDVVDLLTMQSAHELDLPAVLESDFSFHSARNNIQTAIQEHYEIATKAVLSFFSDLHKVWTFSRTWTLSKFSDQGDKLEVSDCHDEIEIFNQMLALVDDGRERTVAGCLTVNALQLRKELVPRLEEQLRSLTKFTVETEKEIKLLKTELDAEKHRFVSHLAKLEADLVKATGFDDYDKWERASRVVGELFTHLEEANKTVADFNAREKHYKVEVSEWPTVASMTATLDPYQKVWSMVKGFCDGRNTWMNGPIQDIDASQAELDVMEWYKKSAKLAKLLEKDTPHLSNVAQRLRDDTGEFRKNLPLMTALATPALRLAHSTQHWDKISEVLSCAAPLVADSTLTLSAIISQGALNHLEGIEEVSMHASKQYGLEKMLMAMKNEWSPIEFEVKDYRNTGTCVIGGLDDIIALLDEHIVKTQTMRGSPFAKGILDDCIGWENRLKYAQSMLDEWVKVQRTWMYLEPIFASEDIMRQLPQEARAFAEVDKVWRGIMSKAKETPHFLTLADPHLRFEHQFKMANTKLDEVQKGLTDYLEVKRNYFPRFFFLSNDELLEIISQTKDPTAVQAHLNKAFEGISRVKFEKDLKITEMKAAKGEIVKLDAPIDPEKGENKGNVECWLLELERMQWQTLKTHTEGGLNDYKVTPRDKWTLRWPQQVILGASSVFWTSEVNAVLSDGGCEALKSYVEDTLNPQLQQIVKLVRGKLNKVQMSTLGALVVIDVHARDTCDVMVTAKVETVHDFNWISQLRYAWDPSWKKGQAVEEGDYTLVCKIVNAKALYGYEYLGNTMRLVITPLTDRCYRTMIGAIELLYGGAPEGPAGTGKTETVKDLSKAVAIHCVVFNCSDSMDYRQMAKFFKGLAGCGSWCCFDEFNRINVEVLSVIAQQLLTINGAKKQGVDMFFFEGTMMKINNNCNAYITMNPGYAGRTELPDNLKALFRPCAMMVPDYALISEIRLYSFGFGEPRPLAQKIVKVLQLSSEQLSSQKHYDYGMRAVQSILVACGAMFEKVGSDPNWSESKIVLRSVYDVNLPKFTVEDLPLFRGITSDLYPGIELPIADHGPLLETIEEQCRAGVTVAPGRKFKQEPIPSFTNKIRELYEMVLVRHGVMICGQTGSGKTVGLHCLKQSLSLCKSRGYKQFQAVKCYTMNPKSIKSSQLYGTFDENTHEWSDGILPVLYRAAARDSSNDRNWVIFDGPVDAVWIENMNTVLDDNKKLCLNSGEIIKMSDEMTMMFEAEDLEQASPATISRVGMVFCETRNVGWRPLRNVWLWELENFKEGILHKQAEVFEEMFEWLFQPAIYFVANRCKQPTPVTDMEMIASLLRLLTCLLTLPEGAEFNWDLNKVCECCFLKALVWSVGATIDGASRPMFNDYLKSLVMGQSGEHVAHADFLAKNRSYDQKSFGVRVMQLLPDFQSDDGHEVTLFDVGFDPTKSVWTPWMASSFEYSIPQTTKFNNIVIPTVDTIRNEFLMDQLLLNGYHVLCTGDTGTGKSVSVKKKLLEGMPERFNSIFLNFSAQTGANQTQDIIDGKLDKRRKGVIGPPVGKQCIIMVDDLNMPAKESYGAQPPIEILRQWMDHAGWYDREETVFRELIDIQFIAAMGPPGGGRTFITQRYVRHFNVLNFVPFSDKSLGRIFNTIVTWFLEKGGFNSEVIGQTDSIVKGTIDIYNTIALNLLPTPSKSHYLFNLRDISKVFQGVSQGSSTLIQQKVDFVRIWSHECMRVFGDRLTDDQDRTWFKDMLSGRVSTWFDGMSFDADVCGHVPDRENKPLLFGNYMQPGAVNCVYQHVDDFAKLDDNMRDYLEEYNSMTKKPMSLVLFGNAIEHISRVSRVINQPYGNALLVGVGGSGRKSLTTLAVSIADFKLFQIEISKSYGMLDWREDMKLIMAMAGEKNQPTVFMMDDTQIVYESFLEDVNGILNTGEVANLYNGEELMGIFTTIEKQAAADGVNTGNANDMYSYFVGRCRENLHVVLCMSPIGEAFRTRLRFFPALVNCCTIDWFTEWPEEALRTVASFFLDSLDMEEKIRNGLVNVCVSMQELVTKMSIQYRQQMGRFFYVTPTSYLELISTFKGLLNLQRTQVSDAKNRYDSGLHKIADTQKQVDQMQKDLIDLQPKLKEATVATDALIVQIDKDTIEANEKKAVVSADEVECKKQSDEANEIKMSCEADLAKALPALDGAVKALKSLSKGDIVEVKAMGKPPNGVKLVMEALCLMFNIKPEKIKDPETGKKVDDYWGTSKRVLLGDTKFLDNLLNYDKDNMDPDMVVKVNKFCSRDDFTPEIVQKGSVAAAGLCKWVHAMMIYDDVSKNVAPKKAALAVASASLATSTALLQEKQAVLKEVLDKLSALQDNLAEAQEKKETLAAQVDDCSKKLARAEQLISGLGGERDRWQEFSVNLGKRYDNVTGDIMLSAGVVAYLGSFVSSYRDTALKTWSGLLMDSGITCSSPFSLAATLGSPVDIRTWVINKLPNDSVSIENAIMLQRSNRWPLMIDPQGQANRWVKNTELKNSLKVVKQNQSTFVRTIEAALQYGNPVLLENLQESIDPILEPVLLKQIVTIGGAATIKLGDATVDYDPNFKLYLTTKLRNPHYPPELCVKVNLLNFMATAEGLEDQMQGIAVAKEEPELEALRERLVLEDAESKATLQEIEDQILNLLQNAEGNILDDEVLINTLAESKRTSNVIEEKVAEASKTQVVIQETRKGYQPVAKHASILFFCIADLSVIDPMYQYSLDWFITLFQLSIDKAEQPDPVLEGAQKLKARIELLNSCFTLTLYLNICRSLFEKDKLLFSCLLTTKIMLGASRLEPSQLHFLLTGAMSVDLPKPNPYHEWLPDKAWGDLLEMDGVEGLNGFLSEVFMNQPNKWKEVLDSDDPAQDIAVLCRPKTTNPFALICVERAIRPDIVVPEMQRFVSLEMGEQFIQPPPLNLMACFEDSFCYTPLIFVLTPGADPISALIKVAEELGKANDMTSISLGQGQGPLASAAIEKAQEKGWWVCLQNCHLSVSWLPTLERICEEINPEACHKDFRLWLTSEPSPHFPAYILQNGVKMTMEPPKGMRASLIGSWYKIEPEWFESCTKPAIFKKLLYGLTFLHATVIERRKFGPLGWNVKYVFSGPDMSICMDQLKIFLNDMKEGEDVPYAALAYLAGECNYGGRCTDDKDRRCLVNIISEFYCEDILKEGHKFSVSGTYTCPPEGDLEFYRNFVQKLPYTEGPEVFGLHNNANISCALTETNDLLNTMQSLQPQSSGSTGKSWDEMLLELAADIASKMPGQYDIDMALLDFPVSYSQCMNTVLVQELIRFNRVIKVVSSSLKEVQRAVKGLVVMSGELEAMGNSVVLGKVPAMWNAVSYPSLKTLGGWVKDFLERLDFLRQWFEAKKAPPRFWISGFFFTQAFITGTLQNFARKFQVPIDQTDFDFSFLTPKQEEVALTTAPADGAYVYGLFMEGARWNVEAHWLDESLPRILFVSMPHLHLWPKEKKNIEPIKGKIELYTGVPSGEAHVYNCPVYKTSERRGVLLTTGHSTNFVMMIRVPMSPLHTQIHWIKRGVAMLTALDD